MTAWMDAVKKAYTALKKKNPKASLSDAMKEAKKTYKKKDITPKNKDKKGKKDKDDKYM
jgi:hypothetical protein